MGGSSIPNCFEASHTIRDVKEALIFDPVGGFRYIALSYDFRFQDIGHSNEAASDCGHYGLILTREWNVAL